jgi:hypothetical protein
VTHSRFARRWLALLLLPPLLSFTDAPSRAGDWRYDTVAAPRNERLFRQVMLGGQNAARALVGLTPLIWDERLAAAARNYAMVLARSGSFQHARQPMDNSRQGENLWMGTRDAYRYDEMLAHWLEERRVYVNGAVPLVSRTGHWEDAGHYSQIVWRGTRSVGCAMVAGAHDDYLVCRYSPGGNVYGQVAY